MPLHRMFEIIPPLLTPHIQLIHPPNIPRLQPQMSELVLQRVHHLNPSRLLVMHLDLTLRMSDIQERSGRSDSNLTRRAVDAPVESGGAGEGLSATQVEGEEGAVRGLAVEHDLVEHILFASFLEDGPVARDDVDYGMTIEHEAIEGFDTAEDYKILISEE